jgi:hypothetical protein
MNTVSGCLIENNIMYKAFPLIEINHGSAGNVVAYNYLEDSGPGCALDSNHGPHNNYNLYEGNVSPNLQADGYFGSVSHDTVFRNWFHGRRSATAKVSWCMSLNRFTRNYSIIGNVLSGPISFGNPNMGNGTFEGTAQPSAGDDWADWDRTNGTSMEGVLTERTSDSTGILTLSSGRLRIGQAPMLRGNDTAGTWCMVRAVDANAVSIDTSPWAIKLPAVHTKLAIFPGPGGYQEKDLDVRASAIVKGNVYTDGTDIPAEESLDGAVLPSSLYRVEKPAWFGDLAWPAFGPDTAFEKNRIPAQVRFEAAQAEPPGRGT